MIKKLFAVMLANSYYLPPRLQRRFIYRQMLS